jgi:hypothetical protein
MKPCPAYFSQEGCRYSKSACYFHHPEEDKPEENKPEVKTGVSTSAQSCHDAVEEFDISARNAAKTTHTGPITAMKDFAGARGSGDFNNQYFDEQARNERDFGEWAKKHVHYPEKNPYQPWQ